MAKARSISEIVPNSIRKERDRAGVELAKVLVFSGEEGRGARLVLLLSTLIRPFVLLSILPTHKLCHGDQWYWPPYIGVVEPDVFKFCSSSKEEQTVTPPLHLTFTIHPQIRPVLLCELEALKILRA